MRSDNFMLPVFGYDSDHDGLSIVVDLPHVTSAPDVTDSCKSYMYRKTDWDRFSKFASKAYTCIIPPDRNLSNVEVVDRLGSFNQIILDTIQRVVPTYRPEISAIKFLNWKIKRLYKRKSLLVSHLKNLKRGRILNSSFSIVTLKRMISGINDKIECELIHQRSQHWIKLTKAITHKDSATFFPKINRYFRPKTYIQPGVIKVPKDDPHLLRILSDCLVGAHETQTHFIIRDRDQALRALGLYLQNANSERIHPASEKALQNIVNSYAKSLEDKLSLIRNDSRTVTTFSTENLAYEPLLSLSRGELFTTFEEVKFLLNRLPNKTSCGPDGIPCIVLKHLPNNMIRGITVIYNNLLNNTFFPDSWKSAIVCPIHKKAKTLN